MIVVQIDGTIIGDGAIPPPRIGSVIRFPLRFVESSPVDGAVAAVRALLKPSGRDLILQYTREDEPRRWEWNGLLQGDGWTASWRGFRPLTGQVELNGRFYADWGYDTAGRVRGRVTRVQLVSERYRLGSGPHGSWEQIPGYRTLRDVEAAPRFFDSSMFAQESGEVDHEVAALVELDLDDVPELPTRSSLVPGDVSASEELLWVADRELPLVVSLDVEHMPTEHLLPGPVGPARSIWATPTGCWVGGEDGTYHCTAGGIPRRVDRLSVIAGAVAGETFLSCTSGSTWVLHRPGRQPVELTAPDGHVTSIAVDDGGFVVLLRHFGSDEESGIRLVRVDTSGSMTSGPILPGAPGPNLPYLTGPPLRVFRGENAWRVSPDLNIGSVQRLPRLPLRGGQVGDYVWIVGHPPDGTGSSGWWPLPGPIENDSVRQFWLFTLLDATTLEPVSSTPIFTTRPGVTIDSANAVWVTADGVRAIPVQTMRWPDRLDVAALVDKSRRSSGAYPADFGQQE
ncbi:hypothetical protein [Nocardia sp. NPDC048505]|uniref:hypothetical protein n=1 Tax=unclassified Nocardia TaxID=2637762 RepID=UPI0033EB27F5